MIESLNRAEALYNNNPIVEHLKGIVYYQSDKINEAKHYFSISAGSSNANVNNKSKEMLALCYIKEDNIPEAEKTVSGLESAGASVMSLIYLRIFSKYAAKGTDDSQNVEKSIMYAQKYVDRRAVDKNEPSAQGISAYAFLGEMYREESDSLKYDAANDLLAYAADHVNEQAKNILKQYGVEGVIVKRGNVKDIPVKFPNGYVITVDAKYNNYLQIYYAMQYKKKKIAQEFAAQYSKKFSSLNDVVNGVIQLYADSLAIMALWDNKLLLSLGYDDITSAEIISEAGNLSLLNRATNFEKKIEEIDKLAATFNINLAYSKATRARWTGVGFGTTISGTISAAVKSSVAAGIMNVGSSMLHGVGDSILKAVNKAEINRQEREVFESANTRREFVNAVYSACNDINKFVIRTIVNQQGIDRSLSGRFVFKGEELNQLDTRTLDSKITNHLDDDDISYLYALLVEKLRRDPRNIDTFKSILKLSLDSGNASAESIENLVKYAQLFRFDISEYNLTQNS